MAARFIEAVKAGDRAMVERMLGEDPALAGARDASGTSALLLAHYHGKAEVAEAILARGPALDVFEASAAGDLARVRALVEAEPGLANAVAPDGFSPLGLAAFFRRREIAAYLLSKGADPSAPSRNPMKVTPLHSAVSGAGDTAIATLLIEAGADVNVAQRHGWTPLHGAAHGGDVEIVTLLIARGADVDARNDDGLTALDMARERRHSEVAALLHHASTERKRA